MSDERKVVDPTDLVAPAGPDEGHDGVNMRNKMTGNVRFSKRGRYAIYAMVALLGFGVAYGLGIFSTQSPKDVALTPSAEPTAHGQAVAPSNNSTLDQITKDAPQSVGALHRALPPLNAQPSGSSQLSNQISAATNGQPQNESLTSALAAQRQQPTAQGMVPLYVPPISGTVPNVGEAANGLTQGASTMFTGQAQTPISAAESRAKARDAAYHSGIFVGGNGGGGSGGQSVDPAAVQPQQPATQPTALSSPGSDVVQSQLQRVKYANSDAEKPPYLNSIAQAPVGAFELWAGSAINAELDTGINADLPGPVVAHITRDVFDSKTGQHVLIPKGSRLIGRYNSQVTSGQARVQVVWDRLIFPDGRYLNLLSQPTADTAGNAGLYADVNDHRGGLITATILTGLLAAGAQIMQPQQQLTVASNGQVVYNSVGQEVTQTGQQIIQKKLDQPPSLTVPIGENFNVLLDRTVVLDPWQFKS